MTSSIDKLKGQLSAKGGLARPNNFMVQLPSLGGVDTETMNVLCRTATMPGKQILTHDKRIGMEFQKVAYGYAVDDVTMTFLMLNDYSVRRYFDTWREMILDEELKTAAYKKDYAKRVVIHQMANSIPALKLGAQINLGPITAAAGIGRGFPLGGNIDITQSVYAVELQDAFPTSIGEISFNNDADGLIEMSVAMSYTNWKVADPSGPQISFTLPI